jgi:hypothetical protein
MTMNKSIKRMELLMKDCGSVTGRTRGLPIGFFFEGAPAPFNLTFF